MKHLLLGSVAVFALLPVSGIAHTLTIGDTFNGASIDVDGFGSFGNADITVDGDTSNVVSESLVNAVVDGKLVGVDDTPVEVVSQSDTEYVTKFKYDALGLEVVVTQRLVDLQDSREMIPATAPDSTRLIAGLQQTYQITNTSQNRAAFDLFRFYDGDNMRADDSVDDVAGLLALEPGVVPVETVAVQTATEQPVIGPQLPIDGVGHVLGIADSSAFNLERVGADFALIAAQGGSVDPKDGFAIKEYDGNYPTVLNNEIDNQRDEQPVTANAYDVTLNLRNAMTIGAGQTDVYSTQTVFGYVGDVPDRSNDGTDETTPLLPDETVVDETGVPTYQFGFTVDTLPDPEFTTDVIWIDPVVAIGYSFTVTGAEFQSVHAPTFATVPDGDGYEVNEGGSTAALAAGGIHTFGAGVTAFSITDIDPALGLDPTSPMAFPVGIMLTNITSFNYMITMTPITFDTDGQVPLPASVLLLGGALGGLGLARRRRRG